MKHLRIGRKRTSFDPLHATRSVQVARMTLRPGKTTGKHPANEHPRSEQWILVQAGTGRVRGGRTRGALRTIDIHEGSLVVVAKGELHQIKNTGRRPLTLVTWYSPPAYDGNGEPL